MIDRIVLLPPPAWERVVVEVPLVMERASREETANTIWPMNGARCLPGCVWICRTRTLAVVSGIVQDLLLPNSFFNQERTDQRRQTARDAVVEPVTRTIERDENDLGLLVISSLTWRSRRCRRWDCRAETGRGMTSSRSTGFVLLLGVVFLYYFWRQEPELWFRWVEPGLAAVAIVIFILAAKLMIPARTLLPYLFPYAARRSSSPSRSVCVWPW